MVNILSNHAKLNLVGNRYIKPRSKTVLSISGWLRQLPKPLLISRNGCVKHLCFSSTNNRPGYLEQVCEVIVRPSNSGLLSPIPSLDFSRLLLAASISFWWLDLCRPSMGWQGKDTGVIIQSCEARGCTILPLPNQLPQIRLPCNCRLQCVASAFATTFYSFFCAFPRNLAAASFTWERMGGRQE